MGSALQSQKACQGTEVWNCRECGHFCETA